MIGYFHAVYYSVLFYDMHTQMHILRVVKMRTWLAFLYLFPLGFDTLALEKSYTEEDVGWM